jgi:hypothetical protein
MTHCGRSPLWKSKQNKFVVDMTQDDDFTEICYLAYYLVYYFGSELTDSQRQMLWACHTARLIADRPDRREGILKKSDADPDIVDDVIRAGIVDDIRETVAEVMECSGDRIFINRCPKCARLVSTPKAKLCLWCGHNWKSKGI